jgi:hypothetical protein
MILYARADSAFLVRSSFIALCCASSMMKAKSLDFNYPDWLTEFLLICSDSEHSLGQFEARHNTYIGASQANTSACSDCYPGASW